MVSVYIANHSGPVDNRKTQAGLGPTKIEAIGNQNASEARVPPLEINLDTIVCRK